MLALCSVCIRFSLLLYFGGDDVEFMLLLFIIIVTLICCRISLHCVVVPLWLKFVINKLEPVVSENFPSLLPLVFVLVLFRLCALLGVLGYLSVLC